MAAVSKHGAQVQICGDAYKGKTPEEMDCERAWAGRIIAEVFARGYIDRQNECRRKYDDRHGEVPQGQGRLLRMCHKTATPGSDLSALCIRMIGKHEQAAKEARKAHEIGETLRRDHSGD